MDVGQQELHLTVVNTTQISAISALDSRSKRAFEQSAARCIGGSGAALAHCHYITQHASIVRRTPRVGYFDPAGMPLLSHVFVQ